MKNSTKYIKLTLLTSVLLKINSGYASQNEYGNNQSASMAPNAMTAQQFPLRPLPTELQGEIMGHLERQTLSRYSRADKNAYHSVHSPNENGFRNPISEQILNLNEVQSFDLDKPEEQERLISFLQYIQSQNRLVDIDITYNFENNIDWSQILPLCNNIRFMNHKRKMTNSDLNDFQSTPLMEAVNLGYSQTVQSLISHMKEINPTGFEEYINYKRKFDRTALELAIDKKDEVIISLLISGGAKLDTADAIIGRTPLMLAINRGLTDVVKAIINKMSATDPQGLQQYLNYMDQGNETALMIATQMGKADIVTILRQAGATQ